MIIYRNLILIILAIFIFSCKEESEKIGFEEFSIDKNIIPDSISKKFSKYNINNDVISKQSMNIGLRNYSAMNQNYICEAKIGENDTLNIWINNFNGYFGNGILINVFNENFKIKSVDPNVIKGIKFEKFEPIKQELTLNKLNFKKGDSIFGKLHFDCIVDSLKHKKMEGYFKAKII